MTDSSAMETTAPTPDREATASLASNRTLATTGGLIVAADYFLWGADLGLSAACFAIVTAAAVILNRALAASPRRLGAAAVLFALSASQSIVALSLSNTIVLALLFVVLVGEAIYPQLGSRWRRWSGAAYGFLCAPRQWKWVRDRAAHIPVDPRSAVPAVRVIWSIAVPALALAVVFMILLGRGNAMFAFEVSRAVNGVWSAVTALDLSLARLVLWILVATLALAALHPLSMPANPVWTRPIPRFEAPAVVTLSRWRSICILAVLNCVFFGANTIDAFYLWTARALPTGVTFSSYVHEGVHNLIAAVLLSAIVLVLVFHQHPQVITGASLRILSLAWIAQNVLLLASVVLRLKLYVDAYQLSAQRVHLALFLLLVAVGFALLARHITARKPLHWLLFRGAASGFVLFFLVQFTDIRHFVAEYNVKRWREDFSRTLDVNYLIALGSSAYSALIRVAETPNRAEAHDAFLAVQVAREMESARLAQINWRSRQIRRDRNARTLLQRELRTQAF